MTGSTGTFQITCEQNSLPFKYWNQQFNIPVSNYKSMSVHNPLYPSVLHSRHY